MITDEKRWRIIQTALHEKQLEQAFGTFRAAGIEPILIKGWAALRHYPENEKRYPGDIDLSIDPAQFEDAIEVFKNDPNSLPIDLHKGLRQMDTLPYADTAARSKLIRLGATDIRVLCDEDHLRVMCVHWLNDGGAYREKLKDIHFAVENRAEDFDWDRCLNAVDKKRRRWVACAILLAHKYLGTKIDDTPLAAEKELPRWLVKAIEKEWRDPVRLTWMIDRKQIWQQLRKRIPPNPLQATVDLGGDFDRLPRIFYQTGDIFYRLLLSSRRRRMVAKTRRQ
jgi:hypothetical protein